MKINIFALSLVLALSVMAHSGPSFAEEASPDNDKLTETQAPQQQDSFLQSLQKKYSLTDAQMKKLEASKLPDAELVKVAELAKDSGKTIDEILKMRLEEKMGWGKIAKELNVKPGVLGQAVASMHSHRDHDRDNLHDKDKDDRRERREERQERKERRESREDAKNHEGHEK